MNYLRRLYERICRILYWGWALRDNYDWDYGHLQAMELLKLKRMLYLFENHGHHDPSCDNYKPKMKSLRLAIKMGERLVNEGYRTAYDAWEKKHGETGFKFVNNGEYTQLVQVWLETGKHLAPAEKDSAMEAHYRDERRKERDRAIFYDIINKYSPYWWD